MSLRHGRRRRAALPRGDRRGRPGLRRRQAPGRVLRAARRARLGRARGDRRLRRRGAACSCSSTASAATCRSPRAPTRRRSWARPRARSARSRASAPTPSRPTRCSAATRSSRSSRRPTPPAPASSAWFARPTLAQPRAGPCRWTRPLHESLARIVDRAGRGARGDSGLSSVGAVTGATRPELLERLRELMPRAIFLLPGRRRAGRHASTTWPRPSGRTLRRAWLPPRGRSSTRACDGDDPAAAAPRRPKTCARLRGRWRTAAIEERLGRGLGPLSCLTVHMDRLGRTARVKPDALYLLPLPSRALAL